MSFQNCTDFLLFSRKEKSATQISSKLLIFSVDQLGLEICRALRDPLTERKKPRDLQIMSRKYRFSWYSMICNYIDIQRFIFLWFSQNLIKTPLTEIKCLRIVYAKIWQDSTRPLVSRFHFVRLMQTHFTSMKCQIGISKCVQSRPSFFIMSQTTQISETAMLFLM